MQASEKVFDRIGQTIDIFKNGFFYISLPFFLYSFVSFIFFGIVFSLVLGSGYLSNFNLFFLNLFNDYVNVNVNINILSKIIIWYIIFYFLRLIFYFFLLLIFLVFSLIIYTPFFIFTIKTINDLYIGKNVIDVKGNISFSISRFFSIFKTYWYIFAYVVLIPALIFILGVVIYILGYFLGLGEIFYVLGGLFITLGLIIFIVFSIIRLIRSTFSLYSAIEKDEFTKENFNKSIELTTNKWGRILGNIFLVGLIIGILSSIISGIISVFFKGTGFGFETILSGENLTGLFSIQFIIGGIFKLLIETIGTTFILVFGFLLYKRFELEFLNPNLEETNEKVIEIEELVENNKNNEL